MFSERMALQATLRRKRVTSEARTYEGMRPYPRNWTGWKVSLLSNLGNWMVAGGTALQRRCQQAVESIDPPNPATGRR